MNHLAQRNHAEVNHAQRDVQHVHSGQAKESGGKLRHGFGDIRELRIAGFVREGPGRPARSDLPR